MTEELKAITTIQEEIKVGEVHLVSQSLSIQELGGLVIDLLKAPEIKEYLDILKQKRGMNGGSYVD